MTEILSRCSAGVSWVVGLSASFLLPRPEKGVWWPNPCRTHPVRVATVALKLTDLVSISRNAATGRATWTHLSNCLVKRGNNNYCSIAWRCFSELVKQRLKDLVQFLATEQATVWLILMDLDDDKYLKHCVLRHSNAHSSVKGMNRQWGSGKPYLWVSVVRVTS